MSYGDDHKMIVEDELEQYKTQYMQYKTLSETLQQSLKDKDALLDHLRQVNQSLEKDIQALKQAQARSSTGSGTSMNPWTEGGMAPGTEPEQYRKLFVGGLDYNTREGGLKDYFGKFGEIESGHIVMKQDQSRGFGFVVFTAAAGLDAAQKSRPHTVEGRRVDTKRALPKEDTAENTSHIRKLFIGGLSRDTTEQDLKDYMDKFGHLEKVEMQMFKDSGKNKGFAFAYFDDFDVVDKLVLIKQHLIHGSICTVKKAVPLQKYLDDKKAAGTLYGQGTTSTNLGKIGNYSSQSSYGNQGSFASNQGSYGSNQGSYGSNQTSYGSNQGSYGSNQGSYGSNQGNYGTNQYGGNQRGYSGQQGSNPSNMVTPSNVVTPLISQATTGNKESGAPPPANPAGGGGMDQMIGLMSAFCSQYMSTQQPGTTSASAAGPVRNTNGQSRSGPYPSSS